MRELPRITWKALPSLLMPVVLLGGIYTGVTTPTEAAAVAAAYALAISAILYRSVSFVDFYRSILASARTTASIGMLIAGALVFNYVVTVENIPQSLSLPSSPAGTCRRRASSSLSTSCFCYLAACWKARRSCWSSCRC